MTGTTRRERHIEALKRMGYEARYWGYSDEEYGSEISGYDVFTPAGERCAHSSFADSEDEAWGEFLEEIGRND